MDDLDAIERILTLEAVGGGLTWKDDVPAIKANSLELDAMKDFRRQREGGPEINGMYRGCEEFCAVYSPGEVRGLAFLWAAVDYMAREADHVARGDVGNASGFAHRYGVDAIAGLIAVLRGSASHISTQWRRAEITDEDEKVIVEPVGTADDRFDEAPFVRCAPDDEHATQITVMDLDEEAFDDLTELLEAKDGAARRAYRAAPPPPEAVAA